MIISSNPEPSRDEFDSLLESTLRELNRRGKKSAQVILSLSGSKLEPIVRDIMSELAINSPFEDSIELIGGQKFPDILAKRFYGVEVKTTTQNHWKTTGNSILESTRVEGVERIFMLFAKLVLPIEFRCRPYEECLSEVVVTHSPRYLIDMNLEKGSTIFDKINIPYDILRKNENPIKPIIEYYRKRLNPGEDLWWIDREESNTSHLIIRVWNNLSVSNQQELKNKGMAYFPEIFSNNREKFSKFTIWLIKEQGIVCPNVRDLFTSGGKGELVVSKKTYRDVPRIFINLFENLDSIVRIISHTSSTDISKLWKKETTEERKFEDWVDLVLESSKKIFLVKDMNLKQLVEEQCCKKVCPALLNRAGRLGPTAPSRFPWFHKKGIFLGPRGWIYHRDDYHQRGDTTVGC
jgi:hypothetical protein